LFARNCSRATSYSALALSYVLSVVADSITAFISPSKPRVIPSPASVTRAARRLPSSLASS
jgi:hypothetical protein